MWRCRLTCCMSATSCWANGTRGQLVKLRDVLGMEARVPLHEIDSPLASRDMLVTQTKIVGKHIADLHIPRSVGGATITWFSTALSDDLAPSPSAKTAVRRLHRRASSEEVRSRSRSRPSLGTVRPLQVRSHADHPDLHRHHAKAFWWAVSRSMMQAFLVCSYWGWLVVRWWWRSSSQYGSARSGHYAGSSMRCRIPSTLFANWAFRCSWPASGSMPVIPLSLRC